MHQVAAAVAMAAAVAVVDNEDGVQWWQRGGCSMAAGAFDGNSNSGGGYGYGMTRRR